MDADIAEISSKTVLIKFPHPGRHRTSAEAECLLAHERGRIWIGWAGICPCALSCPHDGALQWTEVSLGEKHGIGWLFFHREPAYLGCILGKFASQFLP